MANFGNTSDPNTCPTFIFASWFVMTEPPFISEPVPAMVSTTPTGTMSQVGSSKRTQYFSHGSSSQCTEMATAFA